MDTKKIKMRMLDLGLSTLDLSKILGYTRCYVAHIIQHPEKSPKLQAKIIKALHEIEINQPTNS